MNDVEIVVEMTDIIVRLASVVDKLYQELAKVGAAECMGEKFDREASDLARSVQKYTRQV